MRTIALINQKGGAGKTTSAVSLAAALGELGERVLVLDMDPQESASKWLGVKRAKEDRALFEVFTDAKPLAPLVCETAWKGVDIIPGSKWLMGVERALGAQVGGEHVLREAFEALPARWSFVLVDCPPSVGLLVVSVLVACREVIVPVETTCMPLDGLAEIFETVEHVKRRLNPSVTLTGILPCRFNSRRNLSHEIVNAIREKFPEIAFETVVRESVGLAEAPGHRKPITVYDARSPGAEDYASAARELLARGTKRAQRTKRNR